MKAEIIEVLTESFKSNYIVDYGHLYAIVNRCESYSEYAGAVCNSAHGLEGKDISGLAQVQESLDIGTPDKLIKKIGNYIANSPDIKVFKDFIRPSSIFIGYEKNLLIGSYIIDNSASKSSLLQLNYTNDDLWTICHGKKEVAPMWYLSNQDCAIRFSRHNGPVCERLPEASFHLKRGKLRSIPAQEYVAKRQDLITALKDKLQKEQDLLMYQVSLAEKIYKDLSKS